jgi:hypothetical protein
VVPIGVFPRLWECPKAGHYATAQARAVTHQCGKLVAVLAIVALCGCGQMIAQNAARAAVTNAATCTKEVKASPEGAVVYTRLWAFDDTDTASKLTDQTTLTADERNVLVVTHNRMQRCRQIIIAHDNQYAAWEVPYFARYRPARRCSVLQTRQRRIDCRSSE